MDSVMRGYHVNKNVWQSNTDDILSCRREAGNIHDSYAVCMVHPTGLIVGHVPRTISAVCDLFIHQGGTITCQVTGDKKYSVDLPQGGLELKCCLTFSGSVRSVSKVNKLIHQAPKLPQSKPASKEEPPGKKIKLENLPIHVDHAVLASHDDLTSSVWMV